MRIRISQLRSLIREELYRRRLNEAEDLQFSQPSPEEFKKNPKEALIKLRDGLKDALSSYFENELVPMFYEGADEVEDEFKKFVVSEDGDYDGSVPGITQLGYGASISVKLDVPKLGSYARQNPGSPLVKWILQNANSMKDFTESLDELSETTLKKNLEAKLKSLGFTNSGRNERNVTRTVDSSKLVSGGEAYYTISTGSGSIRLVFGLTTPNLRNFM